MRKVMIEHNVPVTLPKAAVGAPSSIILAYELARAGLAGSLESFRAKEPPQWL